jgi:hypothetical protein
MEQIKIGDWLVHEPTGDTFKAQQIWGEYVLVDDCIDSGDVWLLSECRKATSFEIEEEIKRRKGERV